MVGASLVADYEAAILDYCGRWGVKAARQTVTVAMGSELSVLNNHEEP